MLGVYFFGMLIAFVATFLIFSLAEKRITVNHLLIACIAGLFSWLSVIVAGVLEIMALIVTISDKYGNKTLFKF
jgi:hypothetical protein